MFKDFQKREDRLGKPKKPWTRFIEYLKNSRSFRLTA